MASRTSSSIASSKRDAKCRGIAFTISTILVRSSSLGQRSRKSGGLTTCRTPWTTAGRPGISSIATRPFRRSSRDPQCSAIACSIRVSASAGRGLVRVIMKVSISPCPREGLMPARRSDSAARHPSLNRVEGSACEASIRGTPGFSVSSWVSSRSEGVLRSVLPSRIRSASAT
ncbi:MAG: hypothetical protein JWQ55_3187 [Rhodopila sp.]|nr:hypothetical protein [Rhodopila sp.]